MDETNKCRLSRSQFDAVVFDLDGVITQSADLHAKAWKIMFDEFLLSIEKESGKHYKPFDLEEDYKIYVDGKPRYQGVENFLQSRHIHLDYGTPENSSDQKTICGLGNQKNRIFQKLLKKEGIHVYDLSVTFVRRLRKSGYKTAIVSSSKNCRMILEKIGIIDLFDTIIDGIRSEKENIKGKPEPDIFIKAIHDLNVKPERTMVIEDALAGVSGGTKSGVRCVVGVNRSTQKSTILKDCGANQVVSNLSEIQFER